MKAYLISMKDLSVLDYWDATGYVLYPDSDFTGQVTVKVDGDVDAAGNWLLLNGDLWLVESSKPTDGLNQMKVRDPLYAFDRKLIYSGTSQTTVESFIAACFNSYYKSISDSAYKMPYLTITSSGATAFLAPELDSGDCFTLCDYGEAARASGIDIRFIYGKNHIEVQIAPHSAQVTNIVMDDGHYQLLSETYSRETVAKVTVRQKETVNEVVSYRDVTYYLSASGAVSTSVPANRAQGKWETIITRYGSDDPLEKAKELFDKNVKSHKIEFWSDQEMENYTPVRIRFKRGLLFDTRITKIKKTSTDRRVLYTCGNLPTTLTEIVNNKEDK